MCTQFLNPQSVYHLRGSSDTSLTVSHTVHNVIKPIKICITNKKGKKEKIKYLKIRTRKEL